MIRKFVQKIFKIVADDTPVFLCMPREDHDNDSDYDNEPISIQTLTHYRENISKRLYMFPTEISMNAAMDIQYAIYKYEKAKYKKNLAFLDILCKTDQLGFYPKGMSVSPKDMLQLLARYWSVIKNERGINISGYHKYFESNPLSIKFEMISKDPTLQFDSEWLTSEKVDETGKTLIHYATKYKNLNLLAHLLVAKWNPNCEDSDGNTPLFYTTGKYHKDGQAVKLLLQYGATPTHRNKNNLSFIDKAERKYNKNNLNLVSSSGKIIHV